MLKGRRLLHGLAAAAAFITAVCVVDSALWVGRPFMGFLLGRNRIVAPIGLTYWSGLRAGVPFGSQLVAADGRPVERVASLVEQTWRMPVGTPVRYTFATPAGPVERTVPVMRFTLADYVSLFGVWLVNGVLFIVLGFVVAYLKPGRPASIAMFVFSSAWGMTLILSLGDFYRFHFRSFYALMQAIPPAAIIVLGLTFPDRPLPRRAGALLAGLGVLTLGETLLDVGLYDRAPRLWMTFFEASFVYMAAAALMGCALLLVWYRRASADDRARIQLVEMAALIAFGIPALVHLSARLAGVWVPVNLLPISTMLFPIAVAYAILKRDLLDLDPLLTRSVFYAVLTAAVTAGYVLLLGLASAVGPGAGSGFSAWVPFLFTLAVVAIVAPLRRAVQAVVDRVFFRTHYDPEATIEAVSRTLVASLDLDEIASTVRRTVAETMAPTPCLLLLPTGEATLRDAAAGIAVAASDPLLASPGPGARVVSLVSEASPAARVLQAAGVTLVVPLRVKDRLSGMLALGPKGSGALYGARDLGLLRTLGNQAAVALGKAASYAAVRELTTTLEERVADRTGALARTHEALLATQAHLARADKLASLGRLVAGIAHEINNPVAFVSSSVDLIHDAATRLRETLDGNADASTVTMLEQLLENAAICRDGAMRAARIVRELSAFSRVAPDRREPTDLRAALERTLRLLHGEYRDRITIVRDFQEVPHPCCNAGELDQVLMNLLTNAVQAIQGRGEIRVRTRVDDGSVFVEVGDSGPGIAPEIQERIFEPFFTTKAGQGTGLGLAIAHSLVTRHGGDLHVTSAPGAGATFTIRLPLDPPAATAETR